MREFNSLEDFVKAYIKYAETTDYNKEEFMVASWGELHFVTINPNNEETINHVYELSSDEAEFIINCLNGSVKDGE